MGLLLLMGLPKPTIAVQPADQTKQQGQTATFTVQARDAKRFQWSVSGDGVSFEELGGATNSIYTTATLVYPDDDAKHYRVTVANSSGSIVSRSGLLTVTNGGGLPE
jgi:hypothetical protein